MKKLGLIGGVGYVATLEYYKMINEQFQSRTEAHKKVDANPPMTIESLNLATAYAHIENKNMTAFTQLFVDAAKNLHHAGADFAAIAANTAHIVFDEIQAQSPLPMIGIVDETCKYAQQQGFRKLIVFGTNFTMNSGMYEARAQSYGLDVFVPSGTDKQCIHDIIFPNLEAGVVLADEKAALIAIVEKLVVQHQADALVLACTELPLAIKQEDVSVPVLDTGRIHVDAILEYMISTSSAGFSAQELIRL